MAKKSSKLAPLFKAINAVQVPAKAGKRAARDTRKQAEVEELMFSLYCGRKLVEKRDRETKQLVEKNVRLSAARTANIVTRLLDLGVSGDQVLKLVPDVAARFPWQQCRDALFELAKHRELDLTTVAIVFGLEDEGTRVVASEPAAAPAPEAPAAADAPKPPVRQASSPKKARRAA